MESRYRVSAIPTAVFTAILASGLISAGWAAIHAGAFKVSGNSATRARPILIAHRGASAYAPEHTLAAYRLAIEQGADYVEQDLQITKDGVLICLHDAALGRTTDAEQVFPGRAATRNAAGKTQRGWYAVDFTLEEIRRLDAGSWFSRANRFAARDEFARERVPTVEEAITAVGDRAGLYIEMKAPGFYETAGFDMPAKLAALLDSRGFNQPGARERIFIQSFSKTSLISMKAIAPRYRRVQLLPIEENGTVRDDSRKVSAVLAAEIAGYAQGVGPGKEMLSSAADVEIFHRAGLLVHPYTFRGSTTAVRRQPLDAVTIGGMTLKRQLAAEIQRFIGFGIDGGFTDYPDVWRESVTK
jgi:glycerophosphoryl diester phosphodiesterase